MWCGVDNVSAVCTHFKGNDDAGDSCQRAKEKWLRVENENAETKRLKKNSDGKPKNDVRCQRNQRETEKTARSFYFDRKGMRARGKYNNKMEKAEFYPRRHLFFSLCDFFLRTVAKDLKHVRV